VGDRPVSSVRTAEYDILTNIVKQARISAGLTQRELSQKMGRAETFIVKVERGTRRLDVVELAEICRALHIDMLEVIALFQQAAAQTRIDR